MSRIGRLPIRVPQGVAVTIDGSFVDVKGPKGSSRVAMPQGCSVAQADGALSVARSGEERQDRAFHGLGRQLLANAVHGVSEGFKRVLEINGVGYRGEVRGQNILFNLGFSHPILFCLPEGITAKIEKQVVLTLEGKDRDQLGRTAAQVRGLRPPEPYKGKGIKYSDETVRRKAGKSGAK